MQTGWLSHLFLNGYVLKDELCNSDKKEQIVFQSTILMKKGFM